jgi:hypothetical protein
MPLWTPWPHRRGHRADVYTHLQNQKSFATDKKGPWKYRPDDSPPSIEGACNMMGIALACLTESDECLRSGGILYLPMSDKGADIMLYCSII